jgi:hypothetical protein
MGVGLRAQVPPRAVLAAPIRYLGPNHSPRRSSSSCACSRAQAGRCLAVAAAGPARRGKSPLWPHHFAVTYSNSFERMIELSSQDWQARKRIEMNDREQLSRAKIEEAFRIMGQYLLDRKALGEVAIYGGSAILFQFDWRKTSLAVDARVTSERNHGIIIDAVHEAAKQLHLPRSWLNESVAIYARRGEGDADRILVGLYPSPERFGLRVTAAKPEYILAMKLKALDRVTADDRDFQDAVGLGIECGVITIDQMHDVYRKFFGSEELPTAAQLRFSGLIEAIRARLR